MMYHHTLLSCLWNLVKSKQNQKQADLFILKFNKVFANKKQSASREPPAWP